MWMASPAPLEAVTLEMFMFCTITLAGCMCSIDSPMPVRPELGPTPMMLLLARTVTSPEPVNSPLTMMISGVVLFASVVSWARLVTVTVGPPQPPVVAPLTVAQPSSPAGTPQPPVGVGVGVGVGVPDGVGVGVGVADGVGVGVGVAPFVTSTLSISPDANRVAKPIWPVASAVFVA